MALSGPQKTVMQTVGVVVLMGGVTGSISIALVKGEGSPQVLASPVGTSGRCASSKKAKQGQLELNKR